MAIPGSSLRRACAWLARKLLCAKMCNGGGCDRRRLVPLLWRFTVFTGAVAPAHTPPPAPRPQRGSSQWVAHVLPPLLLDLRAGAVLAAVFPAAWEMHRNDYGRDVIAWFIGGVFAGLAVRSEERRVGKECRSRWSPYH